MDVTLPGRVFHEMVFHGAGDVKLEGIDQPNLKLTIMGAGELAASGKIDRLDMVVMGVGDVHMADLAAGTIDLTMMGAGDAEVSPADRLKVTSMGAGSVTLRREPRQIEIVHPDGSGSRAPMPEGMRLRRPRRLSRPQPPMPPKKI